jgi:molybdate transport system substrate-binding protein
LNRPFIRAVALALAPGVVAPTAAQVRGRQPRVVRVAAASDLRFALDEIAARLRDAPTGIALAVTYGSSGTFFAQLVNGAPFDLFMSADVGYPEQLEKRGLALEGSAFTYGVGRLVLWAPATSPLDPAQGGWRILSDPRAAHVAVANPATAPYGRAAEAALRQAGVWESVRSRMVFGETVAQAFQFVQSGAADVGIVALSLAVAPPVKDRGRYWMVPADSYPRLEQGGVILKWAADVEAARAVRSFLTSDAGRALLRRYGFLPAGR